MAKTFRLGARLPYPITILDFLKSPGEDVVKRKPILRFTYKFKRKIGDPSRDEEHEIEETGVAEWDCPAEGTLKEWRVKLGQTLERDQDLVVIEETCSHEIQYAGLCAICGKDMKEVNYVTDSLDTERATVAMVHDNLALTVSTTQAARAEMQLQRRLLKDRKLSLVVDLDQTIIHACIDPTVGEWQRDPSNPNYDAVKDVRSFQLDDGPRDGPRGTSGCWYYIKMRPGLAEFLERIHKMFELHVYTMGTRAYAVNIAKIVDPTQKLFGNRIISRDENESITAKSLQRLFPASTNMAVVIDDRADVWPKDGSNLIKVTPYDFFTGIGDINSSFLPKREDILKPSPPPEPKQPNGESSSNAPQPNATDTAGAKLEHARAVANGDENALLQLQAEEQERRLEKQLKDRPLLHLQEELDREDEEAEKKSAENGDNGDSNANGDSESPSHQRHKLLRDDDRELIYIEKHLTNLHHAFYEEYDERVAEHRRDAVPDVGWTLSGLKSQVLKGTKIVLSGLVPLNVDVRKVEVGMQAMAFGASLRTRVNPDITHLVISSSRPRTQKVRQAARIPSIKIVNQSWLLDSIVQWERLDETPYLIEVHPADRTVETPVDGGGSPPHPRIKIIHPDRQLFEDDFNEEAEDGDGEHSGDEDEDDEDDDYEDRYGAMPNFEDGERSPVEDLEGMEWGDLDKELEEFIGSDMDDSDFESTQGTDLGGGTDTESEEPNKRKRKFGEEDDDESTGSALAKKQRIAKARTTGLRNVKNATDEEDPEGSGLPTPIHTNDEEDGGREATSATLGGSKENEEVGEEDDDDFADLEAELEAELQAESEKG
ncbi:condensin complex non-SMC subunit Cnd1 [Hypoxylon texense]